MRPIVIALLLAAGFALATRPAFAADKEVQLIAFASSDAFENARALTGAVKHAVAQAEGWTLAEGDFSLEILSAALDCPETPDPVCLRRISEKVEAARFIWGTVRKQSHDQVLAHLRLWQEGENRGEAEFTYRAGLDDETDKALLKLAREAFAKLTHEEGTLVISAGKVTGEVLVNGMLVGEIKNGAAKLRVPSGNLTVRVEARGYQDTMSTVKVPPGGAATLALAPIRLKQAPPKAQADGPVRPPGAMSTRTAYGYAGLGLGAAAIITGTFFWIQTHNQANDPAFQEYVNQTPRNQDPCERALGDRSAEDVRKICDANSTSRVMAYVMVPLGVALTGLGTYLLLSDGEGRGEQARRERIQPLVGFGPKGGQLDLRVTF
jgi:hypothetical protein